jgi:hypothetical protein
MLNFSTPPTSRRYEKYEVKTYTTHSTETDVDDDTESSPFATTNTRDEVGQENISPSKSRHSRVLSGTELSPLKLIAESLRTTGEALPEKQHNPTATTTRNPRKMSPEKRFPVKVSNSTETPRPVSMPPQDKQLSLEDALRENEGLKRAMEIFEDEQSVLMDDVEDAEETTATTAFEPHDGPAGPDDTMMSTLSTFSAVPNLTMFARIGHSPTKFSNAGGLTPRGRPDLSPSRTPRANATNIMPAPPDSGNTTNLLMDFTEQLRFPQKSPSRRGNVSPSRTAPNMSAVPATPARQTLNLLDFDIPPLPTPRSIPTITPRELESLKSGFLSEISSLKASLSGKEAEVLSLKTAVGDAEKRVGENMEQLREERSLKEQLAAERDSWEKRGKEMEAVLRKVKDEIVLGQREREDLEAKLDESEKRCEAAEMMAQEAESKMAGMRAGKLTEELRDQSSSTVSPEKAKSPSGGGSAREVEVAVERVARELHALYKTKHETKVAALKKSYENRWEKRVRELEAKIDEVVDENEKLRLGRDATITRVDPAHAAVEEERKAQSVRDAAQIKELGAEVEKLEAVAKSVREDNAELRVLLEKERVEKGELVQLAEEMMSMQSFVGASTTTATRDTGGSDTPLTGTPARRARAQGSLGRASGIKMPGTVESRIGRISQHERTRSGGPGLARPGSGLAARSGIMSSIEKMGSYGRRGGE